MGSDTVSEDDKGRRPLAGKREWEKAVKAAGRWVVEGVSGWVDNG